MQLLRIPSIAVGLLILATTTLVHATTYYVDSAAGSDSNTGTSTGSAYQSFLHINNRAFSPGDTIEMKCGSSFTGGLTITASGNSTNPITFTTYGTGNAPVISNNITYGTYSDAISLTSASYVVINGLKLTNASLAGVYMDANSNHNIVEGCEITNTGEGCHILSQYNLCTGNYIHDLIMVVDDTTPNNDHGANGFLIYGSNNEFSYNDLVNCRAPSDDYGYDGGAFEIFGGTSIPVIANTLIHHNWMEGCEGVIEGGEAQIQNLVMDYNVSLNDYGFISDLHTTGAFAGTISGVCVENNTMLELTTSAGFSNLIYLDSPPTSAQFIFRITSWFSRIRHSTRALMPAALMCSRMTCLEIITCTSS